MNHFKLPCCSTRDICPMKATSSSLASVGKAWHPGVWCGGLPQPLATSPPCAISLPQFSTSQAYLSTPSLLLGLGSRLPRSAPAIPSIRRQGLCANTHDHPWHTELESPVCPCSIPREGWGDCMKLKTNAVVAQDTVAHAPGLLFQGPNSPPIFPDTQGDSPSNVFHGELRAESSC